MTNKIYKICSQCKIYQIYQNFKIYKICKIIVTVEIKKSAPSMAIVKKNKYFIKQQSHQRGSQTITNIGLTAGTFKKRFDGQSSKFRNQDIKGTTLSKYILKLKEEHSNFEI
jgi:transposase-like protein